MATDPFIRIEREQPLSHKVEHQIREAIIQKIFLPGDRLPGEVEMAEKFGVSRTAIREALRMLSGRGLVEIRKGSGVYVSEICMSNVVDPFFQLLDMKCGEDSLLHLVRVRLFMEPEIAKLAAIHRSEDDLQFWSENFKIMKMHADKPEEMVEYDIKFHRRIAAAANNPIIPIIMEPIYQLLDKFISSTYKQSHAPDLAIQNHEKLVECFRNKDSEGAYNTMKKHIMEAEQHVLLYYESIGFKK
jgi:GntR family transcriptional repressor for pyruvate dehydrogenase complex